MQLSASHVEMKMNTYLVYGRRNGRPVSDRIIAGSRGDAIRIAMNEYGYSSYEHVDIA